MVNKGNDINVFCIACLRIHEIGAVQSGFQLIEIPFDPGSLLICHILTFGVNVNELATAARAKRSVPGPVNAEHVAPGNTRFGTVPGIEFLDVYTFGTPLDLLHKDVEAYVITACDRPVVAIQVHFTESCSHGIPSRLAAEFIGQRITNEGNIILRGTIQYPVGICRKSPNRDVRILIVQVPGFKGILLLGKIS